jgi:hypothetical protein
MPYVRHWNPILTVPYFSIALRRGYGLGAMAMARGGFHDLSLLPHGQPVNSVPWDMKVLSRADTSGNLKQKQTAAGT